MRFMLIICVVFDFVCFFPFYCVRFWRIFKSQVLGSGRIFRTRHQQLHFLSDVVRFCTILDDFLESGAWFRAHISKPSPRIALFV